MGVVSARLAPTRPADRHRGCAARPAPADVDRFRARRYVRSVRHELKDEISLAIGRSVASRLRQQPDLLRVAQDNLDRWSKLNAEVPSLLRCYAEWREILKRPLAEICELLCLDNEEAQRLRQNSPFAGILSAREIWRLKESFRREQAPA